MRVWALVLLLPAMTALAKPATAKKTKKPTPDAGVVVPAEVPAASPVPAAPLIEESRPLADPPPAVVDAGQPIVVAPEVPDAGTPEPLQEVAADPTILSLLFRKNILTQAEYDSAIVGLPPPDEGRSPIMGKWAMSAYGFIELDAVGDKTQSFFEQSANGAVVKPGTYAYTHPRFTFGARNSRVGLKLATPVFSGVRASGVIEVDFLGNALTPTADSVVFTGAGPRFRHLAITLETPVVDLLIGQWWQLFGFQPNFFPCTVEIQGEVGEVYGRAPQVRLSHLFKSSAVNVELAAAALFNPQKDVLELPDAQAGIRLVINKWKGVRTSGSTGTRGDSFMLGLSGDVRRFAVPGLNETQSVSTLAWGVSADVLMPIIPATMDDRANALTLNGSFVTGAGIQDLFSGLTTGVSFPSGYKTGLANGYVGFDSKGQLQAVQISAARAGLQYYLPPSGNVWLSLDVARAWYPNASALGSKSFRLTWLGDVNLFFNVTSAFRFGFAYALIWQQFTDNTVTRNHRGLVSAFFLF